MLIRYTEITIEWFETRLIPAKSKLKIQLSVRDCAGVNYIEHLQVFIPWASKKKLVCKSINHKYEWGKKKEFI